MKPIHELVYLAGPYTHKKESMQTDRFNALTEFAANLMRDHDMVVYSPITHCHPIAEYGLPGGWEYWERNCEAMLSRCNKMIVLKLPGWKESVGVKGELEIAERLGIPVEYVDHV